ncbi:MAG: hypothetical protein GC182_09260 [Rhodopseudomonas sp.]|nr:hypothetical protein [Rhodopseudomonas sp.]
MFKAQQTKLARQEKLIGELRTELGKSRSTLAKTRRDVKRRNREGQTLAARADAPSRKGASRGLTSKGLASETFASVPQRSSFSIDASYLYFKPYLTDTYFASTGTAAGSASGTLYGNNPDFNSAFRLGAAYTNGFTGRKLTASYTQLSASSHQQFAGSSLWAARGSADLLANFENYVGTATSDIAMNYRSADILMAEPIDWGVSGLSFLYGAEFVQMDWNETEVYSQTGVLGTSTGSAKFTGVGPQAGLSLTSRPFGRLNPLMAGFSLETRATAGLLLASSTSSISDIYNGTGIGSVQTQSMQRVIPVMHTRAALAYDYVWNDYSLAAKAGYEYHSYINGLQRLGNHDDVADGQYTVRYHNFDLGGFFATLKLTAGL